MATARLDPLLFARLGVPARGARTVDRPRLRALLDGAPEARLVLVAAPAGFGKSTLLSAWVRWVRRAGRLARARRPRRRVVPARALARGRRGPLPGRGDETARSTRPSRSMPTSPLPRSSTPSGAPRSGPCRRAVLVLDDYHLVGDPAIHRLVGLLVDRLPPRASPRDRHARGTAPPARPSAGPGAISSRCVPRTSGSRRPRRVSCSAQRRWTRRGGRRAPDRAHRGLGGGAPAGGGRAVRSTRPRRTGDAVRGDRTGSSSTTSSRKSSWDCRRRSRTCCSARRSSSG